MLQDPYVTKALEYVLGIGFLVLFTGFWRYATGGVTARLARRPARAPVPRDLVRVPEDVMLHPGHAWARLESPGVVTVGVDRFAGTLVGPLAGVRMPTAGAALEQGDPAWRLSAGSRSADMVSPVSGRVLALNERALSDPAVVNEDPYGQGWLMKVQVPRFTTTRQQLLTGAAARHLMAASWEELSALVTPEVVPSLCDGNVAGAIQEAQWNDVAHRLLRC